MATFGERLRARRNRLGWTQDDLAIKTGFSVSSITGWERGINPPNAQSLTKLAEVLGCDAGWLLLGNSQTMPDKPAPPFNEDAPGYGDDHIAPPWIRDLTARLCSLSPSLREKAVRQFHLTLDLMISANSEPYTGRSTYPDKAGSPDDVVAHRAMVGGLIAREQVRGRKATFATGQTTPDKPAASGQPLGTKGP